VQFKFVAPVAVGSERWIALGSAEAVWRKDVLGVVVVPGGPLREFSFSTRPKFGPVEIPSAAMASAGRT
jgi:hypothetical protein